MADELILVDRNDNELGSEDKMEAHEKGKLHRAFSIFVFNSKGEMLLQQRAMTKYHCGGLWTNACCSHPNPGEKTINAAHRRLKEEMGFDCELKEVFSFIYKAVLDHGLTEHEYDHFFIGFCDKKITPNKTEACGYKFVKTDELLKAIKKNPEKYTPWFKIALPKVIDYIEKNK
jgi:isopentenyl-diphosphate delta-isomerase